MFPVHSGQLPPVVAVFVNPGKESGPGEAQRHSEYNPISDAYARFLLDELLPDVEERCSLKFTDNPLLCVPFAGRHRAVSVPSV